MARTLFTSRAGGDLKLLPNREALRKSLSLNSLHFMAQTHSDRVMVVDETGNDFPSDALVTSTKGVGLAALGADCAPITFESERVIGVAHVGRVGMINQISLNTVQLMREMGAQEIIATIGPSICGRCYEVSPEMYAEVVATVPLSATTAQTHCLDLRAGITKQLVDAGVRVTNLSICTLENSGYFSYRRGAETARQAGVVSL